MTLRCRIRSFTLADAKDLFAFASLPEVALNANYLPHRSLNQTLQILKGWILADDIFAIEHLQDRQVFGAISMRPDPDLSEGWFKVGYSCHPAYQGKGYMTEALRKVCDTLIYDRNATGIAVHIFPENSASLSLARRVGFESSEITLEKRRYDGNEGREEVHLFSATSYHQRYQGKWLGELRTQTRFGKDHPILYRHAVRAIVLNGSKILMIKSKDGDLKFPGGGIERNESPVEALKREMLEESGYLISSLPDHFGYIEELYDAFDDVISLFRMRSDYYFVEINETQSSLKLDDYEAKLGFHPTWIDLDQAIKINSETLFAKRWTQRDLHVLIQLKFHQEKNNG